MDSKKGAVNMHSTFAYFLPAPLLALPAYLHPGDTIQEINGVEAKVWRCESRDSAAVFCASKRQDEEMVVNSVKAAKNQVPLILIWVNGMNIEQHSHTHTHIHTHTCHTYIYIYYIIILYMCI